MYYLATLVNPVPIIPVNPNGEFAAEDYFIKARAILSMVWAWMANTTILRVGGINVTFAGLLITCVAFKIIIAVVHHFIPGVLDDSDDDDNFTMPWGWNRP